MLLMVRITCMVMSKTKNINTIIIMDIAIVVIAFISMNVTMDTIIARITGKICNHDWKGAPTH